jgi:SAM-dependent methyltransferase
MSYTSAFFENHAGGSRRSADRIAGIVLDLVRPKSVVDVGCGVGTWLAAFCEAGVLDITGFDGDYVDRTLLQIPAESFHPVDLAEVWTLSSQPWPERRYDLAISLEVAEHLPPEFSDAFVRQLTDMAPAVLFSAAIPRQSGTGHINERWQSEWAAIFASYGYHPHDVIRPAVWTDRDVEPWYAQNALLYLREPSHQSTVLDLVHPRLWEKNLHNAEVRQRIRNWSRSMFWNGVRAVRH